MAVDSYFDAHHYFYCIYPVYCGLTRVGMLWFDMCLYLSTQLGRLDFTLVTSGAVKRAGLQPNDCPYGYSVREIPAFKILD